jgi:hypothetical protein
MPADMLYVCGVGEQASHGLRTCDADSDPVDKLRGAGENVMLGRRTRH